jgi:hypothetical protein
MLLAFALSSVVTYRISNFIVIGNINSTRLTAYASVIISFGVMAVSAGLVYVLSVYLAAIYTSDPDVRGRVVNLAPLAAIFMIPYGLTGSIMGILRGLGHQYLLAKISFLSFWLAGLPTGLYLNFWARPTFDLAGVWYGLILGAGLELIVVLLIFVRIDWKKESLLAIVRKGRSTLKAPGQNSKRKWSDFIMKRLRGSRNDDNDNNEGDAEDENDEVDVEGVELLSRTNKGSSRSGGNWTEEEELNEMEAVMRLQESHGREDTA